MPIAKADAKRRVVLPAVKPWDVFDVQNHGDGRLVLVRLERPEPGRHYTACVINAVVGPGSGISDDAWPGVHLGHGLSFVLAAPDARSPTTRSPEGGIRAGEGLRQICPLTCDRTDRKSVV